MSSPANGKNLFHACASGDIEEVQRCLDRGFDVNGTDDDNNGQMPLFYACDKGHVAVAQLLLDRGADVNRAGSSVTPLWIACYDDNYALARLLLDRGADVDHPTRSGSRPLLAAVRRGLMDVTRLCLERGAALQANGLRPWAIARNNRCDVLADWLEHIQVAGGWTRYLSEPRYKLVTLRALAAAGRARNTTNDPVLDFLFPNDPQRRTRASKQTRARSRLPDDLFPVVLRYFWVGDGYYVRGA